MKLLKRLVATALFLISGLGFAGSASAELITNGDFETGNTNGWINSDNFVSGNLSGFQAFGANALYFGCVTQLCSTFQTIATTADARYIFSFDYGSSGDTNAFFARFNGSDVFHTLNDGSTQFGFTHQSFTVFATGASTDVEFIGFNNPSYQALDNVSVIENTGTVPEPGSIALLLAGLAGLGFVKRRSI